MVALNRVRVGWSGFAGAPGVSTFVFSDAPAAISFVRGMFYSLADKIPASVSMQVESSGDIFESTTGEIQGTWTGTSQAPVQGTSTGTYSAPTGIAITWLTDTHLSGRRLKGRTYLVPCGLWVFGPDGTIADTPLADVMTVAGIFQAATAGNLRVWQRPIAAKPADGSRPAVAARGGGHAPVTSHRVTDKAAVLRSRRD